jgi:hypothetical protein
VIVSQTEEWIGSVGMVAKNPPKEKIYINIAAAKMSAPAFKEDAKCHKCGAGFGMFKRRHHCRSVAIEAGGLGFAS